jgi:hypothetical protein
VPRLILISRDMLFSFRVADDETILVGHILQPCVLRCITELDGQIGGTVGGADIDSEAASCPSRAT